MRLALSSLLCCALLNAGTDRKLMAELSAMKTDQQISTLDRRLQEQPNNAQIENQLGIAYLQKLRETMDPVYLQKAAKLVDKMLSQEPKSYDALRLQNEIDMQRHDFPKVAAHARELLERNPSDAGTVGMLGDALMETGKYSEAGETYRRMVEITPGLSSYNRLAYQLFVTGKPDSALAWMLQAVRAGSNSPENQAWCLTEFGDMLVKTGHMDDARTTYEKALETFPGYHRANAAYGRFLADIGDFSGAVKHLKQAQDSVPLPDYAALLDALYRQTNQPAQAQLQVALIDAIDKLMAVNGETMNRNLAIIYADEGRRLDRALELAKAEFSVRDDVFTYDALSWVLYKQKSYAEASAASRKALATVNPADPVLYYHAGMIALAIDDLQSAKQHLQHAVSLNPKFDFRYAAEVKRSLEGLN